MTKLNFLGTLGVLCLNLVSARVVIVRKGLSRAIFESNDHNSDDNDTAGKHNSTQLGTRVESVFFKEHHSCSDHHSEAKALIHGCNVELKIEYHR